MGNRDDLLAGAKRCLAEKGYAASTVRDIAGAANVSMAAIGYHFGTREALLNAALFELLDEWGDLLATALTSPDDATNAQRYTDMWARAIESFTANRALFAASVEAVLLGQRAPELRKQLAEGLAAGRSGMAATLLDTPEEKVPVETVRTLGSVQLALISGVLLQWLTDEEQAPSAPEIAQGLRAVADLLDAGTDRG